MTVPVTGLVLALPLAWAYDTTVYVDLYFDVLAVFNQSFFIIIVLKCT